MFDDIPKEYKLGWTKFLGIRIDLSLRPFIPRPETAQMVKAIIKEIKNTDRKRDIDCLDLFAGSGAIGLALLVYLKNTKLDFGEKNPIFLKQIKINLHKNSIPESRYSIIQTDIFSNIFSKYDYIIANPPYVAEKRLNQVQKSVLDFEPKEALFGGPEGLDIIKKFLARAKLYLKPGGKIFMEFDPWQKQDLQKLFQKYGYKTWKFFKDNNNFWRWVKIT